jgi:hypothetical protein
MKKSPLKPEMTSTTSTSVSSALTTRTTSTSSDNIIIIKTKIENATERLPYSCFNYLSESII